MITWHAFCLRRKTKIFFALWRAHTHTKKEMNCSCFADSALTQWSFEKEKVSRLKQTSKPWNGSYWNSSSFCALTLTWLQMEACVDPEAFAWNPINSMRKLALCVTSTCPKLNSKAILPSGIWLEVEVNHLFLLWDQSLLMDLWRYVNYSAIHE